MTRAQTKPRGPLALTDHELFVVMARHGDAVNGAIVTWLIPATLVADRPRIVAALSVHNYTWELIAHSGRFVAQMLAEGQHDLVERFGLRSGRDVDKLHGLPTEPGPDGIPLVVGTCGWMACRVAATVDCGDRQIVVADVYDQRAEVGRRPLRKRAAFAQLPAEVADALQAKADADGVRDASVIRDFHAGRE